MENYIQFIAQRCQKYVSHQKKLQIKLFGIELRPKKSTSAYVYLPREWSWGLERLACLKYYYVGKQ